MDPTSSAIAIVRPPLDFAITMAVPFPETYVPMIESVPNAAAVPVLNRLKPRYDPKAAPWISGGAPSAVHEMANRSYSPLETFLRRTEGMSHTRESPSERRSIP